MSPAADTTQLLIDARAGDEAASRLLSRHLHDTLRGIVQQRSGLGATRDHGTNSPVHEAYQRLVDTARAGMDGRAHFLTLAARAMRFVLVDRARARTARRRNAVAKNQGNASEVAADERSAELLALSEALEVLTNLDPRLGGIASLRFFGALGFNEVSEISGRPAATVKRDWTRARAWLYRAMREPDGSPLNRPRWREIDEPFARALELEPSERATYLNGLKAGDLALHRTVNELLASTEEAEAVLGERATVFAAPLIADLSSEDWGDAAPATPRGGPASSPAPLPEPDTGGKGPLVAAFSVLLLIVAVAVAGVLLKDRAGRAREVAGRAREVQEGAVTAREVQQGAVTAREEQQGAVTAPEVQQGAVTAREGADMAREDTVPPTLRPSDHPTNRPSTVPPAVSPDSLLRLARSSRRAGRNADAERRLREALAIRIGQGQGNTLSTAAIQWELGDLLRYSGRYEEAGSLLRSSLVIRQAQAAPASIEVAQGLAALALLECEQGRKAPADSLFNLAKGIYGRLPTAADSGTPLQTSRVECR